jgi:hypothetical protein
LCTVWFGEALQPGGDVDRIAEQVASADHRIADVNADAEAQERLGLGRSNAAKSLLDGDGALDGIDSAVEPRQDSVASGPGWRRSPASPEPGVERALSAAAALRSAKRSTCPRWWRFASTSP